MYDMPKYRVVMRRLVESWHASVVVVVRLSRARSPLEFRVQRRVAEKGRQLSDDNSWSIAGRVAPGVGAIITVEGKRRRLNGGTAGHKSWEKHAWQNCHGPTLRPENMSPSTSTSPSVSLLFLPSFSRCTCTCTSSSFTEPLAPFAVLCTLRNC